MSIHTSPPLVQIDEVWKSYGSVEVLKGVDLTVNEGQVVCLIGPSGGGKSTLLRCINHLERINRGVIRVDGEVVGYEYSKGVLKEKTEAEVCRQRARIGMVFQQFNLFTHMSVLQNVSLAPIQLLGLSKKEAKDRAMDLLAEVGMADKHAAFPSQLSGGQAQRVAISRALAMEPRLMLFDEPTSALDPELVGDVLAAMKNLVHRGMTMLVVTHEMGFASEAADTVAFMAGGEIVEVGSPKQVIGNPQKARTQTFLARVNGLST